MRFVKDLTRHSPEERLEFSRAAVREARKGNSLIAYCLQQAADGIYPEKRLTFLQRLAIKAGLTKES